MSQSSQTLSLETKKEDDEKSHLPVDETIFAIQALSDLGINLPSAFLPAEDVMRTFETFKERLKKIPLDKVGGKDRQTFLLYQLQYFYIEKLIVQLLEAHVFTPKEEQGFEKMDGVLGHLIYEAEKEAQRIGEVALPSTRLFLRVKERFEIIDITSESLRKNMDILYRLKKIMDNSGCYCGIMSINLSLLKVKSVSFQFSDPKPSLNVQFNELNKLIINTFQFIEEFPDRVEMTHSFVEKILFMRQLFSKENKIPIYMLMICLLNQKNCYLSQLSSCLLEGIDGQVMKAADLVTFLFGDFRQVEVKDENQIDFISKIANRLIDALELHYPVDIEMVTLIKINMDKYKKEQQFNLIKNQQHKLKQQKEIKQTGQDSKKLDEHRATFKKLDPSFDKRTKQINKKLETSVLDIPQLEKLKSITNEKLEEFVRLLKEVEKINHPLLKDSQSALKKEIVNKITTYREIVAKIDTAVSKSKKAKEEKQEKKDSFVPIFQKTPEAKAKSHDVFNPNGIKKEISRLVGIKKSFEELEENISKMSAKEVKAELERLNKNRRDVCDDLNKHFYSTVSESFWRELSELQLKTERLLADIGKSMNKVERLLLKKEQEKIYLSKEKDTSPKSLIPSLSMPSPRTESTATVSSDTVPVSKEEVMKTEGKVEEKQQVVEEKKELNTKETVTKPMFDWQKGFALSDIKAVLTPAEKTSVEHISLLANELKKLGIDLLIRGSIVLRWLAFLSTGKLVPANDIDCILRLPADYDKSAFDTTMKKYGYEASATTFKKVGFFAHEGPSFITYKNNDHKTDMTCVQKSYKSTDPFLLTQLQLGFGLENRLIIPKDQEHIAKIAIEHLNESQFVFGWPSVNDVYDSRNYPRLAKYIKKSDESGKLFTFYSINLKNSEAVLLTDETLQKNSRYYYGFKCTHNLHNQNEVDQCYGDIKKMLVDDTFKTPAGKIIVESFCIGVLKRKLKLGGYAYSDDPLRIPDEAEIDGRGKAMANALQHHYSQSGQDIHQLKFAVETVLNGCGTMGLTPQLESQRKSYQF